MKKKILSILLCTALVANSLLIIRTDHIVSADTETTEYYCPLNLTYVKMIAEHLSQIINTSYDQIEQEKGLAKGRYFGTKGEHAAAFYLSGQMKNISLFPCSNDSYPFWEKVHDDSNKSSNWGTGNLTTKLDIMDKSFTITNHSIGSTIKNKTIDCYISPRWTLGNTLLDRGIPWNKSKLTHSFEYHNLSVFHLIADYIGNEFNQTILENLTSFFNMTENDTDSYLMTAFEQRYNFSFDDVEAHPENMTRLPWFNATLCGNQSFVLIREDRTFSPDWPETPLRFIILEIDHILKNIRDRIDHLWPHCEGVILYDYDNLSHDCLRNDRFRLPEIFINGTDGHRIINNVCNYTVNLSFSQQWNASVKSYNLVGQINGSDPDRHHILVVNSLYDSVWSSGTADAAIGCGIVLALGRYYTEHNLTPKYTTQFVLFAGEEAGVKGASSYKAKHKDYKIEKFIDLNQLCFTQPWPKTRLYVGTNNWLLKPYIERIADEKGYETRMNNTKLEVIYRYLGLISDDEVYSGFTDRNDTITFVKGMTWVRHHRDGKNHTEGDSMRYYNDTDVSATSTIVFNISRYFCLNPDCRFLSLDQPWLKDSYDENTIPDSIQINYTINTSLPQDHIKVKAILIAQAQNGHPLYPILYTNSSSKNYTITSGGITDSITVFLKKNAPFGKYKLVVYLFNSTGIVENQVSLLGEDLGESLGRYANDSYTVTDLNMGPPNDIPLIPTITDGPTGQVKAGQTLAFKAYTTDPNGDKVEYQWDWRANKLIHEYSTWQGPFPSGINETMSHTWTFSGDIDVRVRARDIWLGPDFSNWSEPWHLNLAAGCEINAASQVLLGANAQYYAMVYDATEPIQNYTWNFNYPSRATQDYAYVQNPYHTYSTTNTYTQTLNVTDALGHVYTCNHTIQVLNVIAGYTTNRTGAPPNNRIRFNDTSTVYSGASLTNWTWNFGDQTPFSYSRNTTHSYATTGAYNVTLTAKDTLGHTNTYWQIIRIETTPPAILESTYSPTIIVHGSNVSLYVNFFDNESTVNQVKINITTPNNTTGDYTMNVSNTSGYDYEYHFNQTWQLGQYNFTIWVTDHANNTNSSSGCYFTVIRAPYINFSTPPTPTNQSILNHNWVQVNTTISDTYTTSALIDWDRSLKGYWPMDFSNSTGVYDNSTYGNFGRFEGGMTPSSVHQGKYGKAVEFDGINNDIDFGANNSLHLGIGNFTFIVWENSDQNFYTNKAVILTNRPADANAKGYIFGLQNTAYLYVSQSAGNNITLNGHTDVTDHIWHHIAYVRKGTNYSIYVDGAYDAGVTGAAKNITNTQHTSLAYGHWSNNAYFDGLLDEPQLYNRALSWEEINASYNNRLHRLTDNFTGLSDRTYHYYSHAIDTTGNQSSTEMRQVTIDTTPPSITTVSATPNTLGFGYNVTITTNVTDGISGVKNVSVTVSYPAGSGLSPGTVAMTHISGTMYRYVFSNTWHAGRYNYTIIAYDNVSNMQTSAIHSFNVTVNAMMSIATLKDSYTGGQYINLTDPPNPLENLTVVGRGLTWNTYYNASSGCNILESYQGPVNYQGDNGSWTPINNTLFSLASSHPAYNYGYRTGNNHGLFGVYFKPDASSDWPVAFTYNRSNDPTISVVRSKLVGVGYVDPQSNWAYHYLQNVQSSQGQTNGNTIFYPGAFTGTDVSWSYGNAELKEKITMSNTTKTLLQTHPPSLYGLHDASSYLVFITKLDYQNLNFYNNSGILIGNVTISDSGVDLRDALGSFKCGLPLGDAWELGNESARQRLVYRIVHLNGETYLFSGLKISTLSQMMFPVVVDPTLTVYSTSNDGYVYNSGTNYNTVQTASTGTVNSSGSFITIGQKKGPGQPATYYVYRGFFFFNTSALPSNAYLDNATLSLYKKDDYSTTDFNITVQNGQPAFPHDPLQSGDYNRNYYSGNGGAYNTTGFHNGFNNMTLTNLAWITKGGMTKLCLRSSRDINSKTPTGNEYVNVYSLEQGLGYLPKLVIHYRNQSKIKNTGSTTIKGYLLIQIQFYSTLQGTWLVDKDTINETTPRTITSGNQLALDTIFNGHARASELSHGAGTYRVYAAWRDPNGNVLKTSSGVELKAWWQFTKT